MTGLIIAANSAMMACYLAMPNGQTKNSEVFKTSEFFLFDYIELIKQDRNDPRS